MSPALKPGVILSMEQALSMTYATLRFVHLGWRVIKLEATPVRQGVLPGDPNRYIGTQVADADRHSYFVAPNLGKEAIALNLKSAEGQAVLQRIIRELGVDVFCCNTLPARYRELGIDYETLRGAKPDLIWAGISAMGPQHPEAAGYDPAIQAMVGYMEMTGMADGPPTLSGVPLVDLKAGDEVYANIWMAMAKRYASGEGTRIDVSMLQAAASWLITVLPLIDFDCEDWELTRCGNEHRKFVPTNAYPTRDGAVLVAIGSDSLWRRFVNLDKFGSIGNHAWSTNSGRLKDRHAIHEAIQKITSEFSTNEIVADLKAASIPHAPISTVRQVIDMAGVAEKLTTTTAPDGRHIRMPPMATDVAGASSTFAFPPRYGEHTRAILAETGYGDSEIDNLLATSIAAGPAPNETD